MIRHSSPISGVAAHGDSYVATAGYDNRVVLWDQRTRTPLTRVLHDHLANQCAFSPDGRYLVTSSSDYTARLWSVPRLRLLAVLGDHEDDVEMSVFHPAEEKIATASRDHRVRVFDFSGRLLHRFEGHRADVISVEWSHDGRELISSSDDGTIKRWSLETGGMVEDLDMGGVETDTVAIGADGTVYAGNDEGELIIVRGADRRRVPAHDAGIKRVVLGAARQLLITLSYDRTMRLWDVSGDTPQLRDSVGLPPVVWPRTCAFAGESGIVFGSFGDSYHRYDFERRAWSEEPIAPTYGLNAVAVHGGSVLTIGDAGILWRDGTVHAEPGSLCNFLTPVGDTVVTGGQLGTVFDALTGKPVHQHRSPLNCGAAFEREGRRHVVIGAYTGEGIVLREGAGGALEHLTDLRLHDNAVKSVAVSGDLLFSVSADGGAAWQDIRTLETRHVLPDAHTKIANSCAGLGGGWFASVSRDLRLRVWSPDFSAEEIATPHRHSLKCVSADDTGRHIAVGAYNGRVTVYDRETGRWSTDVRPTPSGISSLTHDPGRGLFLASSYDGSVYEIRPDGPVVPQ
ncbi:WD40 repeat domain-containing protein [Streptomyces sp. TRM 70361]|uniref:WD40 repeat domain-containing protein n=1 Tax=Streptomyces sp. TRM 70361 TaxID=3116553 RepID=UPI002E7C2A8F|nr:WD40 repeat domain-containing protein [Streptomyces sp. TRM 70361]MEE1939584.1 WD40 repeat domain-containing protein [Streptomyces sp. TRM 70361]